MDDVLIGLEQADDAAGDEGTEDVLSPHPFGKRHQHDDQGEHAPDADLHRTVVQLLWFMTLPSR